MTEAYNNHLFGKIYIMGLLVKMSPALAERKLINCIYKYAIKPIPTQMIHTVPNDGRLRKFLCAPCIYGRPGVCPNCQHLGYYTGAACSKCHGVTRRYFNEKYIRIYQTPTFTISNVTFNIEEVNRLSVITITSKYNTMQFYSYALNEINIQVIGDLAYLLTGNEFTIVCLQYGRVLRQWHDHRHEKQYPGERAYFEDHPMNFIVNPDGQIKIQGSYRTYLIEYALFF